MDRIQKKAEKEFPFRGIPGSPEIEAYYNAAQLKCREIWEDAYRKAIKDVMEKAEEFFQEYFYIHPHDCCVVQYVSDKPLDSIDDFVKQFRKSTHI